jgi:hypothetical protein
MRKFNKNLLLTILVGALVLAAVTFTRSIKARAFISPAPVNLGTAGNFVLLAEAGITNVPTSHIVGNIGASPITAFALTTIACSEIKGTIYGVDATYVGDSVNTTCFAGNPGVPAVTPSDANKTLVDNAVIAMEAAYTNASGRVPDESDRNGGIIGGEVFLPGVYKWNSGVTIPTDMTVSGGPNDVWIFQITGTLDISANKKIILSGGAQAKNIFWVVAGATTLEPGSVFEGTILAGPGVSTIALQSLATLHGRALGQKDITLISNTVYIPAALHLLKTVVNNNGGTALNTAWTLTATGATSSPTNLIGNTPVNSGSTFKPDTYTLSENGGPSGYVASTYSCVKNGASPVSGNTITLAAGDDATCTITNTDIAPSLRLLKIVANNNSGTALNTAWTLIATGATSSPTNLASTTPVNSDSTFKADTYTLSESGGPSGYNSNYYSCVKNGGAAVSGNTITLAPGDNATCTITNTDIPAAIISSGGGGGGVTYNNPACTDVTYSSTYSTACFAGYQYREVISRTPAVCTLTPAQIDASSRACVSPTVSSVATTTPAVATPVITTSTPSVITPITPPAQSVPKLPNTGLAPLEKNTSGVVWALIIIFVSVLTSIALVLKKNRM